MLTCNDFTCNDLLVMTLCHIYHVYQDKFYVYNDDILICKYESTFHLKCNNLK